jgi:MYXO-CTERM domain-containing protein
MKKFFAAVVVALAGAASLPAKADLVATNLTLSVNHDGPFGPLSALNDQSYMYGAPGAFNVINWGMLAVTSPAVAPGYTNALSLDFTAFGYAAFAMFPTVGTVTLENIAEPVDLSSVRVFVNGSNVGFGVLSATNGFQASWDTLDVTNANPLTPNLVVAWNSVVPTPGALALLGMAGVVGMRRRR